MEDKEKKVSNKKKPNKILYTILMFIVFIAITEGIVWGYGGRLVLSAILNYPQGGLVIREAVLAALVLIVMLLFKNSYVFTQKRENFFKGFKLGIFYLLGVAFFMLVFHKGLFTGLPVINLIIGCFLIGVAEEFLCRGWLLNEFLERFGETKKGVWYSIIVSGLIFGLMHLGNIYSMGQSIPTTLGQVVSAAATGIFFGLIYYKTKNIWTVVTLHGLWDFSLFLGNVVPVTETVEITMGISAIGLVLALLTAGAELINVIPYVKDIDETPKTGTRVGLAFLSVFLFIVFTFAQSAFTMDIGDTYEYGNISMDKYSIISDNYDEYTINYVLTRNIDYPAAPQVEEESNEVIEMPTTVDDYYSFKNNNTGYSIDLECTKLTDYTIFEEEDHFILAYVDSVDSTNVTLRYIYVNKSELFNTNESLNNIKVNMKKYILADESVPELLTLHDKLTDRSYIAAYDVDYGYLVLVEDGKMAVLNRD